jgi:DNA repair exonuclease SbcCD ATPase subunit
MLKGYLDKAIESLNRLIELTQMDIDNIKDAKHSEMFERVKEKEEMIETFESQKALIDREILKIAQANPGSSLEDLLEEEIKERLAQLREKLEELQEINRHYARFVITVGEFYNELYEEMFPVEKDGYTGRNTKLAALIEVRV